MGKAGPLFLAMAWCTLVSACDYGSTTPSSGAPARYDGIWSGTTSQGRPITFTVSSDQRVTAISVGYNFNGISGLNTFQNLNLDIGTPPNSASPSLGPGFGFGSGPPAGANYTQIFGNFTAPTTATGSMIFGAYAGCGTSGGIWTAARR